MTDGFGGARLAGIEALDALTSDFAMAVQDREALLRLVVRSVGERFECGCVLRLVEADRIDLAAATFWHPDPFQLQMMAEISGPARRAHALRRFEAILDRRETVQAPLSPETPGLSEASKAFLLAHPDRTNLATPLIARDRVIGILILSRLHTDVPLGDTETQHLLRVAERAAVAIDNATVLAETRAASDRLRLLTDVSRAFTAATPEVDHLLGLVARTLWQHLGDFASVRPVNERGDGFLPGSHTWHADPEVIAAVEALRSFRPLPVGLEAIRTGRPAILQDLDPEALANMATEPARSILLRLDVRSLAVLPLLVNQRVFALATLYRSGDRPPYDDHDIRLAQDIAVHATLALTNSCLLRDIQISQRRFARLSESGLIGVLTIAPDNRILEANDAFVRMIGYSLEELTHLEGGWRALSPPEWDGMADAVLDELKDRGVSRPREKEYVRKDGTRVPVLLGVALLDDGSRIACIADLTDRKQAERALRRSEEQLRQAQKMDAVGRLAGGVAHDFNNLLSVILSLSDLLLSDLGPNDPMREDLEEIYKAGSRASELTRQLLLFSRQQVAQPRVIDVGALVVGMRRMLARVLGEDVTLTVKVGPAEARVLADPSQLEQVVMNLVVNARDAMPTGGSLTIEVAEVELDEAYCTEHLGARPGPHVMLAVSDTGAGMTRETQSRIFEPFFTTKAPGTGTGLGLSTVFGIVRQAEGSIWVYSEPGRGSTFKVYLPRTTQAGDTTSAPPSAAELRGQETILLVEDEASVRIVARTILKRFGYTVIEARNAGEALLLCERKGHQIHLLLSDVVMPEMSGPELAVRLAATRPGIRVLCMSGYTDDAVVRHGLVGSGIAFLQKPLTPDRLARKVREVLDGPWPPTH